MYSLVPRGRIEAHHFLHAGRLTVCAQIMPPDDFKTSYSAGDLYDLLSTSLEVRFHAAHLFLRYLLLARSSPSSAASEDTASISSEDQESLEAITWDIAVACLALSVKFHRDVLFPLDVIYAHEFVDLAAHEMAFEDLENAQRDVLEAVAYQLGSATPGAFMDELWHALPTLRKLVAFDGGWDDVQKEAWSMLHDALQRGFRFVCAMHFDRGADMLCAIYRC